MPTAPDALINSANLAVAALTWVAAAEAVAIAALFGALMVVLKTSNTTLNGITKALSKLVAEADRKNNLEQIRQELMRDRSG